MKLLLDTHALYWSTLNDPQLTAAAQTATLDPASEVYVSPLHLPGTRDQISIGKLTVQHPSEGKFDFPTVR